MVDHRTGEDGEGREGDKGNLRGEADEILKREFREEG
jgi:hypothetical protein